MFSYTFTSDQITFSLFASWTTFTIHLFYPHPKPGKLETRGDTHATGAEWLEFRLCASSIHVAMCSSLACSVWFGSAWLHHKWCRFSYLFLYVPVYRKSMYKYLLHRFVIDFFNKPAPIKSYMYWFLILNPRVVLGGRGRLIGVGSRVPDTYRAVPYLLFVVIDT